MAWELPVQGPHFERFTAEELERYDGVSSATACAALHHLGVTRTFIRGPRPLQAGTRVVGNASTLQFMPQREDVASGVAQEEIERRSALWAVLDTLEPTDVLVIQAFGSPTSGCLGDMLTRYIKNRGARGAVVDGGVRDTPKLTEIGLPIWATGATPHYASQSELFPWGYAVPIACGGALVLPGDLIIADDDGAVVVPRRLAPSLAEGVQDKELREAYGRTRLDEGGQLADYYPLAPETEADFQAWKRSREAAQ
jgi:Demethylmenaquinone methyltransferase